jgi:hypothetical protein
LLLALKYSLLHLCNSFSIAKLVMTKGIIHKTFATHLDSRSVLPKNYLARSSFSSLASLDPRPSFSPMASLGTDCLQIVGSTFAVSIAFDFLEP